MPLVSKLFGEKLGVSKDALNAQIKEIVKLQQEQLAEIERVSKSLVIESNLRIEEQKLWIN